MVCVYMCVRVCEFERTVCGSKSACVASCPPDLSAVSVAPPVATCVRGHTVLKKFHQWHVAGKHRVDNKNAKKKCIFVIDPVMCVHGKWCVSRCRILCVWLSA